MESTAIIKIWGNIYISRYHIQENGCGLEERVHVCSSMDQDVRNNTDCEFINLSIIHVFASKLKVLIERRNTSEPHKPYNVVVQPNTASEQSLKDTAFLLGAYLILENRCTYDQVVDAFSALGQPFCQSLEQAVGFEKADEEYDIFDCWEALDRFRTIRLADLPPGDDLDLLLDIEEMLHYADPANGAVSVVLPGLLLLFHCPDAL